MLEAGVQGLCCGLVVFSIVYVLRNAYSSSVIGKEEGERRVNGLRFFSVL